MRINVGMTDRLIRLLLGTLLIIVALLGNGPIGWLAVAGIILVATALARRCLPYRLFGFVQLPAERPGAVLTAP